MVCGLYPRRCRLQAVCIKVTDYLENVVFRPLPLESNKVGSNGNSLQHRFPFNYEEKERIPRHVKQQTDPNSNVIIGLKKKSSQTLKWGNNPLHMRLNGIRNFQGRVIAEEDEPAGCPRSTIADQDKSKIRDMSGFLLASVVGLLINTTTLNEVLLKGNTFYLRRRGLGKNVKSPKRTSKAIVPELLPAIAAPNAQVYKTFWYSEPFELNRREPISRFKSGIKHFATHVRKKRSTVLKDSEIFPTMNQQFRNAELVHKHMTRSVSSRGYGAHILKGSQGTRTTRCLVSYCLNFYSTPKSRLPRPLPQMSLRASWKFPEGLIPETSRLVLVDIVCRLSVNPGRIIESCHSLIFQVYVGSEFCQ
ncbi:hypothetical protein TNCV_3182781 [Trichonephila clavipes]|uniref:Uncharacterized protein n=1 Tax=Trichonephila clavipes TaxID=2585209 RepID=A0A8X6VL66_TRICX|nr:hypothetical protein TNCV_3182781 [Trichonephila clavipes]